MSRNVSITEPHPSVAHTGGYIGSGRGGAGNYKHYRQSELTAGPSAAGPAALVTLTKPYKRTVAAGRGGAGNMFLPCQTADEQIFQFDEDMVKRRDSAAPVYHIGRGGMANYVDETKPRTERTGSTDSSASVSSEQSTASSVKRGVEGALARLRRLSSKQ